MTTLEYHAAYYPVEDGWYMAKVLDFPGVITQGRTLKSARFMVKDALRLMAEVTVVRGRSLPKPRAAAHDRKAFLIEVVRLKVRFSAAVP
jgi:predicted RNase H-like HicB family nuclease